VKLLDAYLRECYEAPALIGALMFAVLVIGGTMLMITAIIGPALWLVSLTH
jgi:hypothetical protein